MLQILVLIELTISHVISLIILYEKMDNLYTRNTNIFIIRHVLRYYNSILKDLKLKIQLEGAYDYSAYSMMPEYRTLSNFAGDKNIEKRLDLLKDEQRHIIMAIGSMDDVEFPGYYNIDPCKTRIFLNILSEVEIIHVLSAGINKWISGLLKYEILDPFEKEIHMNDYLQPFNRNNNQIETIPNIFNETNTKIDGISDSFNIKTKKPKKKLINLAELNEFEKKRIISMFDNCYKPNYINNSEESDEIDTSSINNKIQSRKPVNFRKEPHVNEHIENIKNEKENKLKEIEIIKKVIENKGKKLNDPKIVTYSEKKPSFRIINNNPLVKTQKQNNLFFHHFRTDYLLNNDNNDDKKKAE